MKRETPCDYGPCPYADAGDYVNCEYYCASEEPEDDPRDYGWYPEEDDND